MRKLLFIFLFSTLQILSHANIVQGIDFIIRGKVTDTKGSPLPGASVTIENTVTGTSTEREGTYVLSAASRPTLRTNR
jgi:hypothetical protein